MLTRALIAVTVLPWTAPSRAQAQFQPGEFITYSQDSWGTSNSAAAGLLNVRFFFVYPEGGVIVGQPDSSGFAILFTSAYHLVTYLPAVGVNAPLNADLLDPTSSASGSFGGHVTALQLNVDFSDDGYLVGSAVVSFGDLILVNMSNVDGIISAPGELAGLNGLTVRQFLTLSNVAIGTGQTPYIFDNVATLTEHLTRAFEDGQPSQFAQDHLRIVSPGDFDYDADADGADFLKWQQALGSADPAVDRNGNNNGLVDEWDLSVWESNFGATWADPSVAVPEPAAWALGAMGLSPLRRRRFA